MTDVAPHCAVGAEPQVHGTSSPAWRLLVTLAVAGALSGWLVATVYNITLPAVRRHAAERLDTAVREVLRAPVRWDTLYLVHDALTRTTPAGDLDEVPKAYVGYDAAGKRLGVAITAAEPGFQELVTLMIGYDPATGTLIGFTVLDEKETPGLGDKIERDTDFTRQFAGRTPPLTGVKGRAPATPGEVQTITGATISSRAVVRIIDHAVERWRPLLAAWDRGGAT
ncbi:MAG TPA: RnfABCDGE type electron transport complex subunit G [Gemmatimonadales bacterium]|nr:RnfABCDGE type electron transport complex subunit G [Gemmatimonadales bacterium]